MFQISLWLEWSAWCMAKGPCLVVVNVWPHSCPTESTISLITHQERRPSKIKHRTLRLLVEQPLWKIKRWEGTMRSLDKCLGHALWGMAGGIAKAMRTGTQKDSDLTKPSQLRANYRVCTWGIDSYLCGGQLLIVWVTTCQLVFVASRSMYNNACLTFCRFVTLAFLSAMHAQFIVSFAEYYKKYMLWISMTVYLMNESKL